MLTFKRNVRPLKWLHSNVGKSRAVTTWSHLANHFNSKPDERTGFFQEQRTGLLGFSELKSHEGFYLLQENVINRCDELVQEITSPNRTRKIVDAFDELSDSLCKVADMTEFVRLAHPLSTYSFAAEDACFNICKVVEKLNTNKQLYESLKNVLMNRDKVPTDELDEHVVKLFLFDFEQSGIHLDETSRKRVVYLNDCCLRLGQRFMAGALTPRTVSKASLPDSVKKYFSIDGDNYLVSSLYADSGNALAREMAYRLYLYPDERQQHLLTELLQCRHQLATVCGFPTYAHRAVKSSTVEDPAIVMDFLNTLSEKLRPHAEDDFRMMTKMKQSELGGNSVLGAWDTAYYTGKYKKEFLKVSASEFAPYFSLGACMEGVNNVVKALYGVYFEYERMQPGESWAMDIYKLAVKHETEGLLGHIYCDFYDRSKKPHQDCHFTLRGGKVLPDGSYQNPIVVVMLNLNAPRWSGPTLLTPPMVDNLFHEMGHAMHAMLARTKYQHISGTRCSTDFAEVPSVLMEYFASDPRVLSTFARHFQTQEPMPAELMNRLCISKHLFSASETQIQVFYSALDQMYHGEPKTSENVTTTDILKLVHQQYYSSPYVENTAWQLRFSHLVGYGAKYYAYLVSRAIAAAIWRNYFEKDPFSRTEGERYRRECLAHGGGVPSKILVQNFLQHEITPNYLAQGLMDDIEQTNEKIQKLRAEINYDQQSM